MTAKTIISTIVSVLVAALVGWIALDAKSEIGAIKTDLTWIKQTLSASTAEKEREAAAAVRERVSLLERWAQALENRIVALEASK